MQALTTTRNTDRWQDLADQALRDFDDRRIREEVGAEVFGWMSGEYKRPEELTVSELLGLLADKLEKN